MDAVERESRGSVVATFGFVKYGLSLVLLVGALTGCGGGEGTAVVETTLATVVRATTTPEVVPPTSVSMPSPTYVPTAVLPDASAPEPTPTVTPPELPTPEPPPDAASQTTELRFDDRAWTGGWRNRGDSVYGGRTATWIYGAGTDFSAMEATFELGSNVAGAAELNVEGMDDETAGKSRITVAVNGTVIYDGDNPLPNDDRPLETGIWATHTFGFDAGLLQTGRNTITIRNLSPGGVGLPPFFMLDYAEVVVRP